MHECAQEGILETSKVVKMPDDSRYTVFTKAGVTCRREKFKITKNRRKPAKTRIQTKWTVQTAAKAIRVGNVRMQLVIDDIFLQVRH